VNRVSEIVNDSDKYLIWCDFNAEADMVTAKINDAVQVSGSDCPEDKESRMIGFARGSQRVLVSKPSICGFGMNFQICHKIIFLGLSDSYESFYQAVRRCWRFGQKYPVDVVIVISKAEASVLNNIKRKEQDAEMMRSEMIRFTKDINTIKTESLMRESLVYRAKGDMEIPSFIGGVR
jgi:hypothetical protein